MRTLRAYEEYLLNEGLTTSSIRTYTGRLRIVLKACAENGWDRDTLTVSQLRWLVERFLPWRRTGKIPNSRR